MEDDRRKGVRDGAADGSPRTGGRSEAGDEGGDVEVEASGLSECGAVAYTSSTDEVATVAGSSTEGRVRVRRIEVFLRLDFSTPSALTDAPALAAFATASSGPIELSLLLSLRRSLTTLPSPDSLTAIGSSPDVVG